MKIRDVLNLPCTDEASSVVAACCQLLYAAHKISGRTLFSFQNAKPNSLLQKFHEVLNLPSDDLSWLSFYNRLVQESLVSYSVAPVEFFLVLLNELTTQMSPETKALISCAWVERKVFCKCGHTSNVEEESRTVITYNGDDFSTDMQGQWAKTFEASLDCLKCGDGRRANYSYYYLNWPSILFVKMDRRYSTDLFWAASKGFTLGDTERAHYKLVGGVVSGSNVGCFSILQAEAKSGTWISVSAHMEIKECSAHASPVGNVEIMLFQREPLNNQAQGIQAASVSHLDKQTNTTFSGSPSSPVTAATPSPSVRKSKPSSSSYLHPQTSSNYTYTSTTSTSVSADAHNNQSANASYTSDHSYPPTVISASGAQITGVSVQQTHHRKTELPNLVSDESFARLRTPEAPGGFHGHVEDQFNVKSPHTVAGPLELSNLGNTCWVASCCQLLYAAHVHSGRKLFEFDNLNDRSVAAFHSLINSRGLDTYNNWRGFVKTAFKDIEELAPFKNSESDAGDFYKIIMVKLREYMTDTALKLVECQNTEVTADVECDCWWIESRSDETYFLRYAGEEQFHSADVFSEQWKFCFEQTCDFTHKPTCHLRSHTVPVVKKQYFLHWPMYLFAIATSSENIIASAGRCYFEIGERYKACYELMGAAIHRGSTVDFGHYVSLVRHGDKWYHCSDGITREETRFRADPDGDVQLMLFVRTDKHHFAPSPLFALNEVAWTRDGNKKSKKPKRKS